MATSRHFSNEDDPPELQMADEFLLRYLPAVASDEDHWLLLVQLEAVRKDIVRRHACEEPNQRRDLKLVT